MKPLCFLGLVLFYSQGLLVAQVAQPIAAQLGFPELILYNGKIVTMDDASFENRVGSIVRALAIREGKILRSGEDAAIRSLAGPQTKQIDLKGRTVLPGFIMTHEHPTDWAFMEPEGLEHAIPSDNDFLLFRWLEGNAQQQIASWETALKDAGAKAKRGQWIVLSTFSGSNYEHVEELWKWFPTAVTRQKLDQLVPDKPVLVKRDWPGGVVNTKALEEIQRMYPEMGDRELAGTGGRVTEPDVIFKGKTPYLAALLKAQMELWAAQGITGFGSSPYTPYNFQALNYLDQRNEMPVRYGWGYRGQSFDVDTLRYLAGLLGSGSDHFWSIGIQPPESGGTCTTINARQEVKAREQCSFEPGSKNRQVLEEVIRAGGRVATMHSGGDKDIDYFMDAIVKASKDAGLTLDDIRAKRHAFDHSSGAPRPDQIPVIKNLGIIPSMLNTMLWEDHQDYDTSARARDYGVEYTNWSMPRNSTTKAGVMSTFEIDRPLPHKIFLFIQKGITRYNDRYKMVYGASERTDRIIQLKALTRWGAYYLLKEKLLGTLEPGKFADFIVLDRDFLTISENDIPNVKVLMTVVGGKTIHLMPSMAAENGLQPVGPVTWPTKPLEGYFARQ